MSTKPAAAVPAAHARGVERHSLGPHGQIRVIRGVAELVEVRDAWLGLIGDSVIVDPDFFEAALRAERQILRPHVVVLERDGDVRAMLIARVEQIEFGVRAGYRKLYSPRVQAIVVVQDGILGDVDEDTFRALLGSVRESLANREADIAIFRYLTVGTPLYRIASTELPFMRREHFADSEVHWELELPESVDAILASLSSSTQKTVKRYVRKLEKEYADRVTTRVYTEPSEIDEFFAAIEPISAKTYQRALGVSFGDTPTHRERTRVSMEHGWFRGYVLSLDGVPCAFHHGDLYRGRFRHGRPGYDPDFAHLRVGTYLLLELFDDLIRHPDAAFVDYGVGDADYKRRFGSRSWREGSLVVYAPTFRATRVNVIRTALLAVVGTVKRVVGKGALYHRVKRGWRRRLTSPEDT